MKRIEVKCGECTAKIWVSQSKRLEMEITSDQTVSDIDKIRMAFIAFFRFIRNNNNEYKIAWIPSGNRNRIYYLTKELIDNNENIVEFEYYIDIIFILAGLKPFDEIIVND